MTPDNIKALIRNVPDFPKPGVLFRDVFPIFAHKFAFEAVVDWAQLVINRHGFTPDYVAGIESRGWILASALAARLRAGFIGIRKQGKLPAPTFAKSFQLEYGEATLELCGSLDLAQRTVLLVDDLLATGGTIEAAGHLLKEAGAKLLPMAFFVVALRGLGGQDRIRQSMDLVTASLIELPAS